MAQRISVLVALEAADEGLKRAIASAERSLGEMSASAKTAGEKASAGLARVEQGRVGDGELAQVRAGLSSFGDQTSAAKTQLLAFLSIQWVTTQVQQVVAVADAWSQMNARLRLATAGQREFVAAQGELFAIAQRIGVPIQETATLYGKLQQAVRMLGGEQREAFSLRLAAIVDFTFNLGAGRLQTSTLRRRIHQQDWSGAAAELQRWVYGGGRVLPGLVARRQAEARLRIPLIADTHSRLIADTVPGDRGHPGWVSE